MGGCDYVTACEPNVITRTNQNGTTGIFVSLPAEKAAVNQRSLFSGTGGSQPRQRGASLVSAAR